MFENGTIRKLGTVSYSHSMAVSAAVSTQYTNVTDGHQTTALTHASRDNKNRVYFVYVRRFTQNGRQVVL